MLGKLLTQGITDPDDEIRETVFMSLDERFDAHLAQADSLTTLFVAMHDGVSCEPYLVPTCMCGINN